MQRKIIQITVLAVLFVVGAGQMVAEESRTGLGTIDGAWQKMRTPARNASAIEIDAEALRLVVVYQGTRYAYDISSVTYDSEVGMPRLSVRAVRQNRAYALTVLIMDWETIYVGGRVAAGIVWGTYTKK